MVCIQPHFPELVSVLLSLETWMSFQHITMNHQSLLEFMHDLSSKDIAEEEASCSSYMFMWRCLASRIIEVFSSNGQSLHVNLKYVRIDDHWSWLQNWAWLDQHGVTILLMQVAFVGFATQALVTRKGPLENLQDHLANPTGANFITSIGNIQNTLGAAGPSVSDAANAVATATP